MKRIMAFVLVAAMFALSGCAGTLGENGIIKDSSLGNPGKIVSKDRIIYYKPVYYKVGWTRWTKVSDVPEPEPFKELIKFKEELVHDTAEIMGKNGFTMVEVNKNPGNVIFVEMRIAGINGVPLINDTVGATRWYVFHPSLKTPVEIYQWDLPFFGMGFTKLYDAQFVENIAQKAAGDLLKIIADNPATAGRQASSK